MDINGIKDIICDIIRIDHSDLIGTGTGRRKGKKMAQTHITYARMLFSHHAIMIHGNKPLIASELKMSIQSIDYYLTKYNDEIECDNKVFVSLDRQLKNRINAN